MTKTVPAQPKRKLGRPMGVDIAVATREKIIDAATLCFAELGYADASNREIARRAGITSGSLYHYFDSKAALYRAALQDANRILINAYLAVATETPDAPAIDQLCTGLEKAFEAAALRPGMMNFAAASSMEIQRNKDLNWLDQEDAEAFPNYFHGLLKRAKRRGELAPDVDLDSTANVLLIAFASIAFLQASQVSEQAFAASLQSFKQLLKGQIFVTPPAAPGAKTTSRKARQAG